MFLENFGPKKKQKRISSSSLSRLCSAMEVESFKQIRLFQDAVHERVQALPGRYLGSRHPVARYIYRETTMGNFIELKSEQPPMTPAEFFELLSAEIGRAHV